MDFQAVSFDGEQRGQSLRLSAPDGQYITLATFNEKQCAVVTLPRLNARLFARAILVALGEDVG